MTKKYQKKPVVIEALEWRGEDGLFEMKRFLNDGKADYVIGPDYLSIETLEGPICASPGDYIIKGVRGEFYPCKPDIFKETYEEAEEWTI